MKNKKGYKGILILISFIITFIVYFVLNLSIYFFAVLYILLLNLLYLIFNVKNVIVAKVIIELFSIFISMYLITSIFEDVNYGGLFIYTIILYSLIYLIIIYFLNNLFYKVGFYFYNLGLSSFKKENYKHALKYVFVARMFTDCLEFHENKGRVYLNNGQYKKAISEFLKCLEYDNQPYIYEYIAGALTELKNERKALKYRLHAYNLSGKESKELNYLDYQTNLWELWRLHFKQNKYIESLNFIKEYIKLNPNDCEAYNAAGYSASEIDKELEYKFYKQAYSCCLKNNSDKDTLMTTMWNLALTSYDLNKESETISYFNKIISFQPNNIRAQYDLGKVYFNTQNYKECEKIFLEIINLNKEYVKFALLYLVLTYIKNNNKARAIKLIQDKKIDLNNFSNNDIAKEFSDCQFNELKSFISNLS